MTLALATPWLAVPLAVCTAISTAVGGLVALHFRRDLSTVIAFSGGVVVAVALFDVLPESVTSLGNVTTRAGSSGRDSSPPSSPTAT